MRKPQLADDDAFNTFPPAEADAESIRVDSKSVSQISRDRYTRGQPQQVLAESNRVLDGVQLCGGSVSKRCIDKLLAPVWVRWQ